MTKLRFIKILTKGIQNNRYNNYSLSQWNINYGNKPKEPKSYKNRVKLRIRYFVYQFRFLFTTIFWAQLFFEKGKIFSFYYCWSRLDPRYGNRDLLIDVVLYRLLGFRHIRLPLESVMFWDNLRHLDDNKTYYSDELFKYSILINNNPFTIFGNNKSVFNQFFIGQYEYKTSFMNLCAMEGDYCIDIGACWGETSIYFAEKVGGKGRVFSFEFDENNLTVLEQAIRVNDFSKSVKIFPVPLWNEVGIKFKKSGSGAGSKIEIVQNLEDNNQFEIIQSETLDNVLRTEKPNKVDFIKYDVEGAECQILEGSKETIVKFEPILIVALYHSEIDFLKIPKLLLSFCSEYIFLFDHYTNYHEESFLFAVPKKKLEKYYSIANKFK